MHTLAYAKAWYAELSLLLLRSVCGGVRRFVFCFLGCLFSVPSVSKNVPERKIHLRFPIQNRLEIVGCSERYQNQYQIDPGERFVTFSNTTSSRNRCALRTIEAIQKPMQNRPGWARRAISLRFPLQNRLDIAVCPETIQKLIQKRPGRATRLRFQIQNRVELAVCSKTIPKPIQNRPTWTIHYVFQYKIVWKSLCARNDTKINTVPWLGEDEQRRRRRSLT